MGDAEAHKARGNQLFQAGEFLKAAAAYTQAIKLDPDNAVLYSNRSAALLKLKKVSKALEDADKCIELRPEWEKGYFRKGAVLEEQNQLAEALEVYDAALKLCPDSSELKTKLKLLGKVARKQQQTLNSQAKQGTADVPDSDVLLVGPLGCKGLALEASVLTFLKEHVELLDDDVRESGTDFIPVVHLLPGKDAAAHEEQQEHIRAAGAWDSPDTLRDFIAFLRNNAEKLDATAVLSVVPKSAVGYPQTWLKPKWAAGSSDGVFVQLESRSQRALWFCAVSGRNLVGASAPLESGEFDILPRVLRSD